MQPASGIAPAPTLDSRRNATLDYARLVAAFGIVHFHSGAPGAGYAHAALPFFLLVLIILAVPSALRLSLTGYARSRARRLLVPWAVWSAIYLALKLAEVVLAGRPLVSELAPWMLLTGPALHLWFLPFAFLVCLFLPIVLTPIRSALPRGEGDRRSNAIALILSGAALAAMSLSQGHSFAIPFAQWALALPTVLLGLAIALNAGRQMPTIADMAPVAPVLALAWLLGWTDNLAQIGLAMLALAACLSFNLPAGERPRRAAEASLVVYLCHPAVASIIERTGLVAPGTLTAAVLTMALSLGVALIWTAASRRRQA